RDISLRPRVVNPTALQVQNGQWQIAAVAIPKAAIARQQKHSLHRRSGFIEKAPNLLRGEQLCPLLGTVQAHGFLARPLEPWTVAHWPVNQISIIGELEHAADALDTLPQQVWPPFAGHLGPKTRKIIRLEVRNRALFVEFLHQQIGS